MQPKYLVVQRVPTYYRLWSHRLAAAPTRRFPAWGPGGDPASRTPFQRAFWIPLAHEAAADRSAAVIQTSSVEDATGSSPSLPPFGTGQDGSATQVGQARQFHQ